MRRSRVQRVMFSIWVYCCLLAVFIVVGIPLAVVLVFAPRHWYHRHSFIFILLDIFYKSILAAFSVPIKEVGAHWNLKQPTIVIGNHQSLLDIFLLGSMFNGAPHIWYALSFYAKMPIFGFLVRNLVFAVDPKRPAEAARGFIRGLRHAEKYGLHVALFPEGGRFNDGKIHRFMRGFAVAARTLNRSVLPVYMPYNGHVYLPTAWRVERHELLVIRGPGMVLYEQETDDAFVTRVFHWFTSISDSLPS